VRAGLLIGLALFWAACSAQSRPSECGSDAECGTGQACYKGFCIASSSSVSMSTSTSPSISTGTGGRGASMRSDSMFGEPDASPGSMNSGGASSSVGGTGGDGGDPETPPATLGECNDGMTEACLVQPDKVDVLAEVCNRGTRQCVNSTWGPCVGKPEPAEEVCNGLDDDCNGMVDEIERDCYPDGQLGCALGADGIWKCSGTCAVGKQRCQGNDLGMCEQAQTPQQEVCTPAGALAQDEDCNGDIDEPAAGCTCVSGAESACYNGPDGTLIDGSKCKAGKMACINGMPGACEGEVTPGTEDCTNPGVDDNCDGMVDNIASLGEACKVAGRTGLCADGTKRCQQGMASPVCTPTIMAAAETCDGQDNDCDGKADEDFDLMGDSNNCGRCGRVCAAQATCCGGGCVRTAVNASNCGMCGHACAAGEMCRNSLCEPRNVPMAGMPAGGTPATGGTTGGGGTGAGGKPGVGGTGATGGAGTSGTGGTGGMAPPDCTSTGCATGSLCCDRVCVPQGINNCGACGTVCDGDSAACCDGRCVSLAGDPNCGTCGVDCSATQTCCVASGTTSYTCESSGDSGVCP